MLSEFLSPTLVPWGSGGLAFLVAVALTPVVQWGTRKTGWVARPEAEKWHTSPTALLGGIAMFAAGGVVLAGGVGAEAFPAPVWAGAALLFVAGVVDDMRGLGPWAKLLVQLGSAVLALSGGLLFAPAAPLWVSLPLTLVWLLGLPNALNLLDAMDGVAASVAVLAAVFFGGVAGLQGLLAQATVAAATAGAAAGFLVFTAPPARIFMGDCGSLVLGYMLAVLGLGVQGGGGGAPALVPVLILAVPIFDTTFVSVTRTQRGESVANGGTDHTMHRLARLQWSERQVLALLCGGGLLAGGVGVVGQVGPPLLFYVLAFGVMATALGSGWLLARRTAPSPEGAPRPASFRTGPPPSEPAPLDPETASAPAGRRSPTESR